MKLIGTEFFHHEKGDKHDGHNSNRKTGYVDQKQSGIISDIS